MPILVLGSGSGLGHFIPAMCLADAINRAGSASAEVDVFESHLPDDKKAALQRIPQLYRSRPRLSEVGQRLASFLSPSIDPKVCENIVDSWHAREITQFVILSGYWDEILNAYAQRAARPYHSICIHIDSVTSPSWNAKFLNGKHFWWCHGANGHIAASLPAGVNGGVPWGQREPQLIWHGGGWGLQTRFERVAAVLSKGWHIVAIGSEIVKVPAHFSLRRVSSHPSWHPWKRNDLGNFTYPEMFLCTDADIPQSLGGTKRHLVGQWISRAQGIVGKPPAGQRLWNHSRQQPQ